MTALASLPHFEEYKHLAPYTSFHIGGPARYFFQVEDSSEIPAIMRIAAEEQIPVFILGGGYNILIADTGFPGVVIVNKSSRTLIDNDIVVADGGTSLPLLISQTLDSNLVGLEYLFGIPGTVGGAVRGNAGVPDHEIGDLVLDAMICDSVGNVSTVFSDYFQFGYRESILKKNSNILLSVRLQLQKGDGEIARKTIQELKESRIKKQPVGRSCGSFFKNPSANQSAGMLIDQCGLKGFRIGDAIVSPQHANFIMNAGSATYRDMIALITHIKKSVFNKFGIILEEEVQIVA